VNIGLAVQAECWIEKKRTVQDRKKSQKSYIPPVWGEAPTEAIYVKNCVVGDGLDVITYAKFQNEIFRGCDFIGFHIFYFSIDFWMGVTTVHRYCAACDETWIMLVKCLSRTCFW